MARVSYIKSAIVLLAGMIAFSAAAQPPASSTEIYNEPTRVNLGGRPVIADIAFYADMEAAEEGDLRLALVTDVTKFIEETERDLENWVATKQERCGDRWSAGEPQISFPDNAIRFVLYLELQMYRCGLLGKSPPSRYNLEGGEVDVTLEPYIENGKLQAKLIDFQVEKRSGVSRFLPLEFVIRRVIHSELEQLNHNRKFYRAPQPLFEEGFSYESIGAEKDAAGNVVITSKYKANGSADKFDTLIEKIRRDGITQER